MLRGTVLFNVTRPGFRQYRKRSPRQKLNNMVNKMPKGLFRGNGADKYENLIRGEQTLK